jgi:ATP-dependent 26S proteasome regulatory subunit
MRVQVLSGAQLFSMYVGEGEALLRAAFQRARMTAPSIILIDEIDAVIGRLSIAPCSILLPPIEGS